MKAFSSPAQRIPFFSGRITSLLLAFCIHSGMHAAQVDETTARTVAANFLAANVDALAGIRAEHLELVHVKADPALADNGSVTLYRVFNHTGGGYVIIAGDDLVHPILAYSIEKPYVNGIMPIHVAKWFEGYATEIREAVQAGGTAHQDVALAWERLAQGIASERDILMVPPLLSTTWNQSPHYNALCPGGSVTGCVATAMAQVMKYHGHPAQGAGFHSYNAPNYGTLSANFGATTYDWGAMPNNVTSANNAVATLMYHCGVAVDMQYSPQVSGAWVIQSHSPTTDHNSEYAMKTYFGYDPTMQGVKRENYNQTQWINLLKGELDASRPILYAGWGSGGGHAFVCDGYDSNDFFHFNWGWGGAYDGFFMINALNPDGVGTGGGTGGFNSGHQALVGIKPATGGGGGGGGGNTTFEMGLYNFVSPSATTLYYGQAFTVSTNIWNSGDNDFSGDYCAAVFDGASNFYGYVEVLQGYTLPSGMVYNQDLVFSSTGLFSMLPGTYYVGVFYKPSGGEWVLVSNNGSYTNLPQIQVINPNDIEMWSDMVASPGTTVEQGSSLSVNLNILNDGFNTFMGQYGVALYNLDGSWAQDVGVINENNGLPSGYAYLDPNLTIGHEAVTVEPGTYLLAVQHNPSNSGWQLTGSSYHQNPIMVNVVAAGVAPDQYEVNDNSAQAATLTANFTGNNATVNTSGANLHNPTDQDFFKIDLAPGFNYTILPRLHDSYNSGNGQTYSVDGLFSYSTDGSTWSSTYDDVMPSAFILSGGGTVRFHVAPYFQGETGTYQLQVDITRSPATSIADGDAFANLVLRPNPANDQLWIDLGDHAAEVTNVRLFDTRGALVAQPAIVPMSKGTMHISVGDLAEGTYMMRLETSEGIRTERMIIQR